MANSMILIPEQIKLFNIPLKAEDASKNIRLVIDSIGESENEIIIESTASFDKRPRPKHLKIVYDKTKLTPYESVFIGWSLLNISSNDLKSREEHLEKAKQYLISAIENGAKSCLPYYLLVDSFKNDTFRVLCQWAA